MKSVIYYFTGTGNSLDAAKRIAEKIGDCELVSIAQLLEALKSGSSSEANRAIEADRVGFVFPVYFWGLPAIVHDFLDSVTFAGSPYLFCVATRGGPSGWGSFAQVNAHMKKRGRSLDAGFSVLMPGNYPVSLNPSDAETSKKILDKFPKAIGDIANTVIAKRPSRKGWQNPLAAALFSKNVNGSFVRGVRASDRKFTVSSACISCGKCEKTCSVGNVALDNGKPVWHGRCEQCFGCYNVCPTHAINFGKATERKRQYVNPNVEI